MRNNFKIIIISISLLVNNLIFSQVGIGTNNPDSSAALEITSPSNNKGVLLPRITQSQRTAISSPANGLIVYQTDATSGLYYYNGGNWIRFGDVQTVNGVSPSLANGNIALTFLNTQTGTQNNRTSTSSPADGLVHIVTGNTPSSENGKVYIYSSANSSWNETSAFTDDQDISGSSFDFATGDLVIEITGGASETISLASLTVTPTLDQVTDVGSTTSNGIDVGSLTVNSSYTLPTTTSTSGFYLTVSTTTSELVFSSPPIPNGTADGDVIHWNPAGNWERTNELKIPFSGGSIVSNRSIEPKTDASFNLGGASKRFTNIYGTNINSGVSSLTLNTSATGTPTISFQQSGSEKAGIGFSTFFIGDSSAGTHYFFPQKRPISVSGQVLSYSAASSLTWTTLPTLPQGNQEGMSLRWNNSTSNWETASSTLIFSGGVSATTVTATNISIGSQITFSSNATTVPPLNLIANNLNDGVGALRMEGSEPDIYLNQNSAGFNTVTFATNDVEVNAFGKNNADDFYITVKDGGGWKNDTFNINNTSGDISMGYKLSVTGSTTLSELKVGATGSQYTLPSTLGTAGQVLTVSTTTNLLTFENPSDSKYYILAQPNAGDSDLKASDDILNFVATSNNGISTDGKYFTLPANRTYKLTAYVEVSGTTVEEKFQFRNGGTDIGIPGSAASMNSSRRAESLVIPTTAFVTTTSSSVSVVLRCTYKSAGSGTASMVLDGTYVVIEEL